MVKQFVEVSTQEEADRVPCPTCGDTFHGGHAKVAVNIRTDPCDGCQHLRGPHWHAKALGDFSKFETTHVDEMTAVTLLLEAAFPDAVGGTIREIEAPQ